MMNTTGLPPVLVGEDNHGDPPGCTGMTASDLLRGFSAPQLVRAYERAVDASIISSITDTDGVIIHANERFCETSQYAASELIGNNHRIVNSRHHPREFFSALWRTISRGSAWHGEIRNRAKDGSLYWVDSVIVPIKDGSGNITHYLSLRTLITGRKALEREREGHLAALESLLVMTSHSFRKPLAALLDQAERLNAAGTMAEGEMRATADLLRSSVKVLESSTKELATFIRDMRM